MDELWIVRHALSKGNVGEKTSSPETTTLESTEGRAQAIRLADALMKQFELKGHKPDYVGASSYFRTQQTLFPTLERLGFDRYEVLLGLRELTYLSPSKYNGTNQEERKQIARQYWENADPDYVDGEGADSFNQAATNIKKSLDQLRNYSQRFGLFASHGLVMTLIDTMDLNPTLQGKELMIAFRNAREQKSPSNASLMKLQRTETGWAVQRSPNGPFLNLIGN